MPFFSRSNEAVQQPAPVATAPEPAEEHKHFSLFGGGSKRRHRSTSPSPSGFTDRTSSTRRTAGSNNNYMLDQQAGMASGSGSTAGKGGRSFMNKFNGGDSGEMDSSVMGARTRVQMAEQAEYDADQALEAARARVREAREEVQRIEKEAKEDARRAQLKQHHAREVSKLGRKLGRHDL